MFKENSSINHTMLKDELRRIKHNLKIGYPVISPVWLTFSQPNPPAGSWGLEELLAFLTLFAQPDSGATVTSHWCVGGAEPDVPDTDMGINIVHFILLCGKMVEHLDKYHKEILTIAAGPWQPLIESDPTVLTDIQVLLAEASGENGAKHFSPHNNDSYQKAEYERVFSALKESNPVLSHWFLFMTYDGDEGGDSWTPERLYRLLVAFAQGKKTTVKSIWTSEPLQPVDADQQKMVFNDNGDYYKDNEPEHITNLTMINLTDFIWLCCQQKAIIHSQLVVEVAALATYPFAGMIKRNNPDVWLKKTVANLNHIHQLAMRETRH